MSPLLDDDVDERIRSTLLRLSVGDAGPANALTAVRAGARSRRNRRRMAVVTGAVVVLGLAGFAVVGGTDDQPVRTAAAPDTPTTATTGEYPPSTPLADGPLPVVPKTTIIEYDGYVHSIESRPGEVTLSEFGPGGGASVAFDPEMTSALEVKAGSWGSGDPDRKLNVLGVTRADVARVEWIVPSGVLGAETFGFPALPQLRFFFVEDPERLASSYGPGEAHLHGPPHVIGYGTDGTVLVDSEKIDEYESTHVDELEARQIEVDRRRGVEVEEAGIVSARVDEGMLFVEMYKCEGDPWADVAEDDAAVRVSASVKRPLAEGACLSGETMEVGISFGEPVGDRPVIDAVTGEVLIEAGAGL